MRRYCVAMKMCNEIRETFFLINQLKWLSFIIDLLVILFFASAYYSSLKRTNISCSSNAPCQLNEILRCAHITRFGEKCQLNQRMVWLNIFECICILWRIQWRSSPNRGNLISSCLLMHIIIRNKIIFGDFGAVILTNLFVF